MLQTTVGIHVRLSHTGAEATDYGCTSHASIIQCNWKWHCAVNGHQSKSCFLTCWSWLPVCSGYLSNIQGPSPHPFEASSAGVMRMWMASLSRSFLGCLAYQPLWSLSSYRGSTTRLPSLHYHMRMVSVLSTFQVHHFLISSYP